MSQQLLDYIKEQIKLGKNQTEIEKALTDAGWAKQDIDSAFKSLNNPPTPTTTNDNNTTTLLGEIDLLKKTWSIYKKRVWTLLGILFIPILTVYIFGSITAFSALFTFTNILKMVQSALNGNLLSGSGVFLFLPLVIIILIIDLIIQLWGQAALVMALKERDQGIGIIQSYRQSWGKIRSYTWVLFLSSIILLGGWLLAFIPGLILSIWFAFSTFIVVCENLTGFNAILKSREYVKGHWGGIFFRIVFIIVAYLIFSSIIETILKAFNLPTLNIVVGFIINLFIPNFVLTYLFCLYENLRSVKGNFNFVPSTKAKVTFWIIGIFGILVIPASIGILTLTTMKSTTMRARDATRSYDQHDIQMQLKYYFTNNKTYPSNLEELLPNYFKTLPLDPKTKLPYEYKLLEDRDYQLCINFEQTGNRCVNSIDPNSTSIPPIGPIFIID